MESPQGTDKEFARSFLMGQLGRRNRNPSEKTGNGGSSFVFSARKVERKLSSSSSTSSTSGNERRASFVKKNPEKMHYGIEVQAPSPFDVAASRNNQNSSLQSSSTESLQDRYHQAVQMVRNDTSKPILSSNKWQVGLKTNDDVCDTLVQKGYSKVAPPTPGLITPESPKSPSWNPPQSKSTYRPTREFIKSGEQQVGTHNNSKHTNGFNNGYHTSNGLSVNGRSSSSEDDNVAQKQQHTDHVVRHKVAVSVKQPINLVISKTNGRRRIVVSDTTTLDSSLSVEQKAKEKNAEEERLLADQKAEEERLLAERRKEEERLLSLIHI